MRIRTIAIYIISYFLSFTLSKFAFGYKLSETNLCNEVENEITAIRCSLKKYKEDGNFTAMEFIDFLNKEILRINKDLCHSICLRADERADFCEDNDQSTAETCVFGDEHHDYHALMKKIRKMYTTIRSKLLADSSISHAELSDHAQNDINKLQTITIHFCGIIPAKEEKECADISKKFDKKKK